MKIFLTGATGVMGTSAARALLDAGHDVSGLARTAEKADSLDELGVTPVHANLFDSDQLAGAVAGHDVVCNLATHVPVGLGGMRARAWRLNDRIRIEGSRVVAEAAAAAGVRRLIQESISFLYADGGDEWIDEQSAMTVTRATEPAAVAETNALAFKRASRDTVVLRFGSIMGDDPLTRWRFARARSGQPVGIGDPRGWAHVVHPDDVGSAVVAALTAPGGVYNVGAAPVRRADLNAGFFHAAGQDRAAYLPKMVVRLAGERLEPLTRSHRISSQVFSDSTGWRPRHPSFAEGWLSSLMVGAT
ncbi:MAG TPA: NAD(P)-dependent oxidoreductase [Nocardioidaceae bacterium]|nr:NAD(P)-dependent oxidoreductase [Nocardioidaceae bacterium]